MGRRISIGVVVVLGVAGAAPPAHAVAAARGGPAFSVRVVRSSRQAVLRARTLRWGPSPRVPDWSALVADPEIELMRFQPRVVGSRRGELVVDPVAATAPEVVSLLALIGAYRVILSAEREPARAARRDH